MLRINTIWKLCLQVMGKNCRDDFFERLYHLSGFGDGNNYFSTCCTELLPWTLYWGRFLHCLPNSIDLSSMRPPRHCFHTNIQVTTMRLENLLVCFKEVFVFSEDINYYDVLLPELQLWSRQLESKGFLYLKRELNPKILIRLNFKNFSFLNSSIFVKILLFVCSQLDL